jgi:hypothetical protein
MIIKTHFIDSTHVPYEIKFCCDGMALALLYTNKYSFKRMDERFYGIDKNETIQTTSGLKVLCDNFGVYITPLQADEHKLKACPFCKADIVVEEEK